VRDDEDMMQLVESIKERGVITPATVRPKENGRYELVSGHRRKRACELAGMDTLRCEVVELTRDEATILMVESNFQRSQILPSEKAFAYKMRLEAMNRQGKRSDLTSTPVESKLRSNETLGSETGESREQIRRYVRLTFLVKELLDYVDDDDELFVCMTYGTKPLSTALMMATQYAYRIKSNTSISCVVYGLLDRNVTPNVHKVYDMTALIQLDEIVRILAERGVTNPKEVIHSILEL